MIDRLEGNKYLVAVIARPRLLLAVVIVAFGLVGGVLRYVVDKPISVFGNGPAIPPALETLLPTILTPGKCHSARQTVPEVEASIRRAGLEGWTVELAPGVGPEDCLSSTVDAAAAKVVLISGLHPTVKAAIDRVAARLLDECHSKASAIELVKEAIAAGPSAPWELRTDGGVMGPSEQMDQVHAHVDAGCWIYAGTGTKADGSRVYWVGGRE